MTELMEFKSEHVKATITYLLCMFKKIENVTDEQRNWKCKKTQKEIPEMKNTVSEVKKYTK